MMSTMHATVHSGARYARGAGSGSSLRCQPSALPRLPVSRSSPRRAALTRAGLFPGFHISASSGAGGGKGSGGGGGGGFGRNLPDPPNGFTWPGLIGLLAVLGGIGYAAYNSGFFEDKRWEKKEIPSPKPSAQTKATSTVKDVTKKAEKSATKAVDTAKERTADVGQKAKEKTTDVGHKIGAAEEKGKQEGQNLFEGAKSSMGKALHVVATSASPEKEDEDEETHKIRQRVMLSVGGVSTAAVVGGCAYATYLAWPKDGKGGKPAGGRATAAEPAGVPPGKA